MPIRSASIADAARILDIYAPYIEETAISFELEVPTLEEFRSRMATTLQSYPYLVAEQDGTILGYAYAGPLGERAAYARSCELSIYLDRRARGRGLGRTLYEELERRLREQGILNLYACIADPVVEDEYLTYDSERFHAHMGFHKVGKLHKCGHKFGHWYNIIWMEKFIGEHP